MLRAGKTPVPGEHPSDSYEIHKRNPIMTEHDARTLIAEVLVLRNNPQWRAEDDELIASGKVLNSQVGGKDVRERAARLREMAPGPLILQADLETGSYFAQDGTEIPPLMAVGAADDEQLAYDWGFAVGLEGLRIGLDVTWSPVLDINTNPDNPIINVRSFGESEALVSRLGAAVTKGMLASGLTPCAKHWPGHGDVAVDSHISLPTLPLTLERLREVEWAPYRAARQAGLECIMTAHLLLPHGPKKSNRVGDIRPHQGELADLLRIEDLPHGNRVEPQVEHHHPLAPAKQTPGNVGADEAGASGHHHGHRRIPFSSYCLPYLIQGWASISCCFNRASSSSGDMYRGVPTSRPDFVAMFSGGATSARVGSIRATPKSTTFT
jgi:hypothetical protein